MVFTFLWAWWSPRRASCKEFPFNTILPNERLGIAIASSLTHKRTCDSFPRLRPSPATLRGSAEAACWYKSLYPQYHHRHPRWCHKARVCRQPCHRCQSRHSRCLTNSITRGSSLSSQNPITLPSSASPTSCPDALCSVWCLACGFAKVGTATALLLTQ